MGVRTIIGTVDGTRHGAAMYDSVTGWMIGPIWEADDAEDQIEAFLDWLAKLQFMSRAAEIELESLDLPKPGDDGNDVRQWPARGLIKLIAYWRRAHTTDGVLAVQEGAS